MTLQELTAKITEIHSHYTEQLNQASTDGRAAIAAEEAEITTIQECQHQPRRELMRAERGHDQLEIDKVANTLRRLMLDESRARIEVERAKFNRAAAMREVCREWQSTLNKLLAPVAGVTFGWTLLPESPQFKLITGAQMAVQDKYDNLAAQATEADSNLKRAESSYTRMREALIRKAELFIIA